MPPRRGGRGRGMIRARPPQVIRESMQEIGMGSMATYEALAKEAALQNSAASRAFYPPLRPDQKTAPAPLVANEKALVALAQDLAESMRRSPHAVRARARPDRAALAAQLDALRRFYFACRAAEGGPGGGGAAAASPAAADAPGDRLWDLSKSWVNLETLPPELRPRARGRRPEPRPLKRRRVAEEPDGADAAAAGAAKVGEILGNPEGDQEEQTDAQAAGDAAQNPDGPEDDADDAQDDAAEGAQGEVDDDLELDADYQTGVRFDDDDGYEEADSGAEEATF